MLCVLFFFLYSSSSCTKHFAGKVQEIYSLFWEKDEFITKTEMHIRQQLSICGWLSKDDGSEHPFS